MLYPKMEMKQNNHFTVARLEESILDVIVENVHLITTHRSESKTCIQATPI